MVEMYFNLVLAHKRTCDPLSTDIKQVPANLRNSVVLLLEERGYDQNGNPIA